MADLEKARGGVFLPPVICDPTDKRKADSAMSEVQATDWKTRLILYFNARWKHELNVRKILTFASPQVPASENAIAGACLPHSPSASLRPLFSSHALWGNKGQRVVPT